MIVQSFLLLLTVNNCQPTDILIDWSISSELEHPTEKSTAAVTGKGVTSNSENNGGR